MKTGKINPNQYTLKPIEKTTLRQFERIKQNNMKNYLLKMSAVGNRFLVADSFWFENNISPEWKDHSYQTNNSFEDFLKLSAKPLSERKEFIKKLISSPALSLTDGLVVLKKNKNGLSCDFYNKDGSTAEMCGNAASCISAYIKGMSLSLKTFLFGKETVVLTEKGGIALKNPSASIIDCDCAFNGKQKPFTFIQPGAPHGVIEFPREKGELFKKQEKLKPLAQQLRFKNPKNNQGMNVSFFQVEEQNRLKAMTYERGVEGFTLACGTGALAVAFVYLHKHLIKNLKTIFVNMPGGELKVQLEPQLSLFSPVKKGY